MVRDPKTGLPLIGARDTRPIKLRIIHKNNSAIVFDQESERPLAGIMDVRYRLSVQGVELVLLFAPDSYELLIEGDGSAVRPPARIVMEDGAAAELKDGEQLVVADKDGNPTAVLTVTKVNLPAPAATPAT